VKLLKKQHKIIIAVVHGLLLFTALWLLSNSSYTSGTDEAVMKKVASISSKLYAGNAAYDHNLVFINVSRDLKLVPDLFEYGEIAITDRNKLAQFFRLLANNGNRHHFVICDIFFEFPDDDDTALLPAAKRCTKLLFPFHIQDDSILKPCIDVSTALSDYKTSTGNFSKFKLVYKDSVKTTPMALLEQIDKKHYPASFLDFKSIFPRFYVTSADISVNRKYPYYNLGEMLMLSETDSFYHKFLENKFIVIGNFETDIHNSAVGSIPGPLILLNTYLSVRNRGSISWWWALFMIISLAGLSYLLFFGKVKPPVVYKHPWLDLLLQVFVNSYISFFGICLLLAVLSELIFSVQTSFSLLLTYLLTVNFFMEFYKRHYKKPDTDKLAKK
jgi:hypothetical protein